MSGYNHGYEAALSMVNTVLWGAGGTSNELVMKAIVARDARVRRAALEEAVKLVEEETTGGDFGVGSLDGSSVEGIRAKLRELAEKPGPELNHFAMSRPNCAMCGKTGLSTNEDDGGTESELEDGRWVCSFDCWERATS